MRPKRGGQARQKENQRETASSQLLNVVNISDTSDSSIVMTGKRAVARRGKGKGKASASSQSVVPGVYQEMLAEALPMQQDVSERPLKRRRRSQPNHNLFPGTARQPIDLESQDEEEDIEFEDVLDNDNPDGSGIESKGDDPGSAPKRLQTAYRDSADESEESDFEWEGINLNRTAQGDGPSGDLELTLATRSPLPRQTGASKRRTVTKAERQLRLQTHKLHVLCLLSYMDRRNHWCNDPDVQELLKPLVNKKMLTFLRPKSSLSQFGRAESLKRGLDDLSRLWRARFRITARGMRRSLWAEEEKDLHKYKLPPDADTVLDKSDFRDAAKTLKGSRDIGAQLYCTLLRSVGVEARLVGSLQPLSFNAGGPVMAQEPVSTARIVIPDDYDEGEAVDINGPDSPFKTAGGSSSTALPFTPLRRLGHPNAADYHMPDISAPVITPPKPKIKIIHESPYPIFWVEVLDEAHQKWLPVDPLVTETIARPRSFEPPASDRENNMSYVVAFEEEGTARDVTRRYTKAYNAKTIKNRVDSTEGGIKWWRRTMRAYSRGWRSDLDQIEDTELAASEAKEPMPKNVADFKDHPYYALERHLKRNEVLVSTRETGKVAAGRDPSNPGQKKLESIYRRRDVKTVRSADAWYRLGKEVKIGEQPVKTVPTKRRPEDENLDDDVDMDERAGTNLYTESQTELYEAPPIVNGRVPRNSFGNLDIFVPSMVPKGGVHIPYNEASRAARILGIDYADALTGFEFRGRQGTAVLKGIVVATEYREAVEAVIEGFLDERAQAEEEARTIAALKMWKWFLVGLRIKERVSTYEVDGEENEDVQEELQNLPEDDDDDGMESEVYFDDGAGGFFLE